MVVLQPARPLALVNLDLDLGAGYGGGSLQTSEG